MTYSIIEPPFTLKFREMPKKDLRAYREWFHAVTPERLMELAKAVNSTAGFEDWKADHTPDSLTRLGEWFQREVETRKRTTAEMNEVKTKLTFPIEIPELELTNRTFSLAMDIGMYFGELIIRNLPGTRWDQLMRSPNFVDYGQPVIMGFGKVPLNPVRLVVTLAYSIADRKRTGNGLRELFDIWSKLRS